MDINEYIYATIDRIDMLKSHVSDFLAIEGDIPDWQEKTHAFITARKQSLTKMIESERAKWAEALHIRDTDDATLNEELKDLKMKLDSWITMKFAPPQITATREQIGRYERLMVMKDRLKRKTEGDANGYDDNGISVSGAADAEQRADA